MLALKLQRGVCNALFSKAFLPKFAPSLTGSFFAKKTNVFRGFSSSGGDKNIKNMSKKEIDEELERIDEEDEKILTGFKDLNKLFDKDIAEYDKARLRAEKAGLLAEFDRLEDEEDAKLFAEFEKNGTLPDLRDKELEAFFQDRAESFDKRLDEIEAGIPEEEEKPQENAEDLREFQQKYGPPEDGTEEGQNPPGFNGVISPTPGVPTSFLDKFFYWFRFPIMAPGDPYPDPWTINYYVRCDEILEAMKIPEMDRDKFIEDNDFSQGYATLEWCLPSPPPHHTFEECPFMKEAPEEDEEESAHH